MLVRFRANKYTFTDLLIYGIILLSIGLYTLFIPYGGAKLAVYLSELIVFVFLILHIVYNRGKRIPMNFRWEIGLIFIGLILSTFAANLFHNQGFSQSLISQHDFYFFLFYFLLHYLKPDPKRIINMFLVLGFIYLVLYLVQYFLYPRLIVSCRSLC